MRAKRPYIVLSFRTTVAGDGMGKTLRSWTHIPGRLIPLPRGALCRVRPCVADAARGLAAVAEPHRPRCLMMPQRW